MEAQALTGPVRKPRTTVREPRGANSVVTRSCSLENKEDKLGKRLVAVAALPVILIAASCSSAHPAGSAHATLPAGTAQLAVRGQDAGTSEAVNCLHIENLTIIRIGSAEPHTVAAMLSAPNLQVEWVRIRNVRGFDGSYDRGLSGDAKAAMTGSTYRITGTAEGLDASMPGQVRSEAFEVKARC